MLGERDVRGKEKGLSRFNIKNGEESKSENKLRERERKERWWNPIRGREKKKRKETSNFSLSIHQPYTS